MSKSQSSELEQSVISNSSYKIVSQFQLETQVSFYTNINKKFGIINKFISYLND